MMARRSTSNSSFGSAVSVELTARQMTQFDLADQIGKSLPNFNRVMTGRRCPSPMWVNLVADALKLSAEKKADLHRAAAKDRGYQIDLGEYPTS